MCRYSRTKFSQCLAKYVLVLTPASRFRRRQPFTIVFAVTVIEFSAKYVFCSEKTNS